MPPVIINVVSHKSNTGKTTLIEGLLPELAALGLQVGALKGEVHRYNLDIPGKDTWRFSQAGAAVVGMTTPEEDILIGSAPEKGGTAAAVELLDHLDLILIEGNKQSPNPKIEVVRGAVHDQVTITDNLLAVVSDQEGLSAAVPVFALEDSAGLARFIYRQFFSQKEAAPGAEFTHFDAAGRPRMVDVTDKEHTRREAYARGEVLMAPATLERIKTGTMAKGDVLAVAQVAAIMAVKETGRLIPMAHPLPITGTAVDFHLSETESKIEIGVRVKVNGPTGVEMEALTGVAAAALTIYDMCKAVDKEMVIQNIRLMEKKGGRSGHYRREQD